MRVNLIGRASGPATTFIRARCYQEGKTVETCNTQGGTLWIEGTNLGIHGPLTGAEWVNYGPSSLPCTNPQVITVNGKDVSASF